MTTKTETVNAYDVQFVFDYSIITTTVFAMHEDAAPDMAADQIYSDLGFSTLSSFLAQAQEINVTLTDKDVL